MIGRVLLFTVYSIAYEALVLGGAGFVVFGLGRSPWWMLLGVALSTVQLKPSAFGIGLPEETRRTVVVQTGARK